MSRVQARMVRVYLSESDHEMEPLLRCLTTSWRSAA